MAYTKRRVFQHIMEDRSVRMIQDLLPNQWVIRPYQPDYGIDLTIELFEYVGAEQVEAATLGETLFVQMKSTEVVDAAPVRVYGRRNVEKGPLKEDRLESAEIEVARLRLDTSELLTVQAIGSAIPVLLFLVELSTRRIYFVCLNDLIEKVIIPEDPEYAAKQSKVLHIPLRNCISDDPLSVRPLETYAKRPKLYAAFEKFAYQKHELGLAQEGYAWAASDAAKQRAAQHLIKLVRHFLAIDLRYDFWARIPEWKPIGWSYLELRVLDRFLQTPEPGEDLALLRRYLAAQPAYPMVEHYVGGLDLHEAQWHFCEHLVQIWTRLDNLSRLYEELVREWFLPTLLATTLGEDLRASGEQRAG